LLLLLPEEVLVLVPEEEELFPLKIFLNALPLLLLFLAGVYVLLVLPLLTGV
jgi:hypothetical protein